MKFPFLSIDALVVVPPSSMNADDDGRPKTALFGDVPRLRWSSQSLKRAWRTSSFFEGLDRALRTRDMPHQVQRRLADAGASEKLATAVAQQVGAAFGAVESKKEGSVARLRHKEIVVYTPRELEAIDALVARTIESKAEPPQDAVEALPADGVAIDVALFGRMRAAQRALSVDAACAVAHALATTRTRLETDYWSAVDDLATQEGESGSAHINERVLGSAVMYEHVDVDLRSLVANMHGDAQLAARAIGALTKAVACVHPRAGRSQFGTNLLADYLRATRTSQPVSLMGAFEKPVEGLPFAIEALRNRAAAISATYGLDVESEEMCVPERFGNLDAVATFAVASLG